MAISSRNTTDQILSQGTPYSLEAFYWATSNNKTSKPKKDLALMMMME